MTTTLNGLFTEPKPYKTNFIQENKKNVKKSASGNRVRTAHSQSSVHSLTHCSSSHTSACQHRSRRQQSTRSCQTVDPNKLDQLFHEGVIRYPSARVRDKLDEKEKEKNNRLDVFVEKQMTEKIQKSKKQLQAVMYPKIKVPTDRGAVSKMRKLKITTAEDIIQQSVREASTSARSDLPTSYRKGEVPNYLKGIQQQKEPEINASEIIQQSSERLAENSSRSSQLPSSYRKGEVPKYLKDIQQQREMEMKRKEEHDPQCPPGHVPLSEEERAKTLERLQESYEEAIKELNLLPVRTDTLRVRQKKMELEKQLAKLEDGIKVFSKTKVYIKLD